MGSVTLFTDDLFSVITGKLSYDHLKKVLLVSRQFAFNVDFKSSIEDMKADIDARDAYELFVLKNSSLSLMKKFDPVEDVSFYARDLQFAKMKISRIVVTDRVRVRIGKYIEELSLLNRDCFESTQEFNVSRAVCRQLTKFIK